MAIAPSKLGDFLADRRATDAELVARLRRHALVKDNATDEELLDTFERARLEHERLGSMRDFNSPHERVRVFLAPYLTEKGRAWAVPLDSLNLPDDDPQEHPPTPR